MSKTRQTAFGLGHFNFNQDAQLDSNDLLFFLGEFGTKLGDANADQSVDFSDFLILSVNFGESGNWSAGDFDCNGHVEFDDFLVLSENFGFESSVNAVPEPISRLLMLIAIPLLLRMQSIRQRNPNRTWASLSDHVSHRL